MTKTKRDSKCTGRSTAWFAGLIGCFVLFAMMVATPAAAEHAGSSGQPCIKEKVGGNPPCTANDVRIGGLEVIEGPDTCIAGEPLTVTMRATIESGPDRYDIGIWINEVGGLALTDPDGTCYRNYFHPLGTSTVCDQQGGPYWDAPNELDNDVCGDVYAQNTDPCGNKVIGPCTSDAGGTCLFSTFDFTATFVCGDGDGNGFADVGTCTSWDNNANNMADDSCGATNPLNPELDTDPGTGSKCNCSDADSPVQVGNITICGDGVVQGGEQCDPGNPVAGDCCTDTCQYEPVATTCGDDSDTTCDNPDTCDAVGVCQANNEPDDTPTSCGIGECAAMGSCQAGVDTCAPGTPAADDSVCDGLDNDCDGSTDEEYAPLNTDCGTGACASTGVTSCDAGTVTDTCTPGDPSAEVCDNVDNDCDGPVDEDLTQGTECGIGACEATGTETCDAGAWVGDTCTPGDPSAEVCDNVDNDCDGPVDEDLTQGTECGIGACEATGTETCDAGAWVGDTCTPGDPSAEVCDNVDNDCDGPVDEDLTQGTECGIGACEATGTETCDAGNWVGDTCTPGDPSAEVCDNVDNDCDGPVDEDLTQGTECGIGACEATGTETCDAGNWVGDTCTPGDPSAEVCDNVDNDCDGPVDEDLTQGTECGIGACEATGTETCDAGAWVGDTCTPGDPSAEVCDNVDNDCDGPVDEDLTQGTECGIGACEATGTETCDAGNWVGDTCTPGDPSAEVCDNVDNDCDGPVDEDLTQGTECGIGACEATGTETCDAGNWVGDTCTPGDPSAEVCDNVDNDCDGPVDEDLTQGTECGIGACEATGTETCDAGAWVGDTCTPGDPSAEVCDNVDNDCDGPVDEDLTQGTECGIGACEATGTETCDAGAWVGDTCTPGDPSAEVCDNVDNDCDGPVDEDLTQGTECGIGACEATGTETCDAGNWVGDTCTPGDPSAEVCDNVDNDCDGPVDEDLTQGTECGIGACEATGTETCDAGAWVGDTCTPGDPSAEVCDNVDNDCDGPVDEDLTQGTECGIGACEATGTETCDAGAWVGDTCTPGDPSAEVCDNVDNDCDGPVDEDLTQGTECGIGACEATGTETCDAGNWVGDTCTPGDPSAEVCDNVDNDCDGPVDEDLTQGTECGIGACEATGTETCDAGAWVGDTCTPGDPSAEVCDNVDNDCDGPVDEDLTQGTECGIGACEATGTETCDAGNWVGDTCTPGDPSAEVCDNVDNDCDGPVDEDLTQGTECGIGACEATGTETCDAGNWVGDTCTPGDPSAEVCDNVDNDCDGPVDEDLTQGTECGIGACEATGTETCDAGAWVGDTCTPGDPSAEVCDNVDNDCDGPVDEDLTQGTECGIGACEATGTETCDAGAWVGDTCTPGDPSAEVCDNVDNDCDGPVDEDLTQGTECGIGACEATGTETCDAGVWVGDTCTPGDPSAEVCDNVDNDCDGPVDEDLTQGTECGIGACEATGTETCDAGNWVGDTCTPGDPSAEVCDNVDNDCDGPVDEDLTQGTECGIGACEATGTETCDAGNWVGDTCTPGDPSAEVCDNVDNDCDGPVDEDLTQGTECGIGACEATGTETCDAGAWVGDTCTPGDPSAEVCDNVDNDCDGPVDEDLTQGTECGIGACEATGTETCDAGNWVGDTCTPGDPSAEVCDNVDNDCDGPVDEDLTQGTECGIGACEATGTETCDAGVWVGDTCTPGDPSAEVCDNVDNDCDGPVDEDLTQGTECGIGACEATGTETCDAGNWVGDTCDPNSTNGVVCDTTCADSGGSSGGGTCTVSAFECSAGVCSDTASSTEDFDDTCGGTGDDPSVTWYSCSTDNTTCESSLTEESDSCGDSGSELGGGSCSATDWTCESGTLVSTSSDGSDTCDASNPDNPSVDYFVCSIADGNVADTCTAEMNDESDSCTDDGGNLGGGTCSATDWTCDPGGTTLVSTNSSGTDTCDASDPDNPSVDYFVCTVTDGGFADTCTSDMTDMSDSCTDSGDALGGGSCSATDWTCAGTTLVSTTTAGTDLCNASDPDNPTVDFFVCTAGDGSAADTCSSEMTDRSDSCIDDGSELGGGSCSADDWTCDTGGTTLVLTETDGDDACGGTTDNPSVDYFVCSASDGTDLDTCSSDTTSESDSCTDDGDLLGGGSCSATDWDCDSGLLSRTDSAGTDSCVDDPTNGATTTFYACNASDGTGDDSCVADMTDCSDELDETCRDGFCDDLATSCVLVDKDAGDLCRDGDTTDTVCTDPDVCDGAGECLPNNQPCAFVTSSSLCPFDVNPNKGECVDDTGEPTGENCDPEDGDPACTSGTCEQTNEFRLVFTPDVKNWVAYKQNASNPGQYFYNLVYEGEPNSSATLDITIPYPFVTQGAMPLHVYDGELVGTGTLPDGQTDCFLPPDNAYATSNLDITLDDYRNSTAEGGFVLNAMVNCAGLVCADAGSGGADGLSADSECVITVDVPIPDSGQVYVNLHLDWGLKGGNVDINPCDDVADRYDLGAQDTVFGGWDALANTTTDDGPVAIANCNDWGFSHTDGEPDGTFSDSVRNLNEFKKVKGVMGSGRHSASGQAVVIGTPVELVKDETGEIVDFGETDEDGYYALPYKHTGKQATYTVHLLGGYEMSQTLWLKANGTAVVEFDVDSGTAECDTTAQSGCGETNAPPPPPGRGGLRPESDGGDQGGMSEEQPAQSEFN